MPRLRLTEESESRPLSSGTIAEPAPVSGLEPSKAEATPVTTVAVNKKRSNALRRSGQLLAILTVAIGASSFLAIQADKGGFLDSGVGGYSSFFTRDTLSYSYIRARLAAGDTAGAVNLIAALSTDGPNLYRRNDLVKTFVARCIDRRDWDSLTKLQETFPVLTVKQQGQPGTSMRGRDTYFGIVADVFSDKFSEFGIEESIELVEGLEKYTLLRISSNIEYQLMSVFGGRFPRAPLGKEAYGELDHIQFEKILKVLSNSVNRDYWRFIRLGQLVSEAKISEAEAIRMQMENEVSKIEYTHPLIEYYIAHGDSERAQLILEEAKNAMEKMKNSKDRVARERFTSTYLSLLEEWKFYSKQYSKTPSN